MTTRQIIGRGLLVLAFAAIVGAGAYLLSDSQERKYGATTKLLFSGSTPELRAVGVSQGGDEERAIANNTLQVGSYDIARRTAEVLDDPRYDADAIASRVSVSAARGSDVVTIAVSAESAQDAADIAGAYRRQYTFQLQDVVRRRAKVGRVALADALRDLPKTVREGARGDALRTQIAALSVIERAGGDPLIVEGVRAGADPISPNVPRDTIFGVLFGAVLGIGLVALRSATVARREPPVAAAEPTRVDPPRAA